MENLPDDAVRRTIASIILILSALDDTSLSRKKVEMSWRLPVRTSQGEKVVIHNLRYSMTYQEFYNEAYVTLGPEHFRLYLIYEDSSLNRVKITVDTFLAAFKELYEVASGQNLNPWGTLFVFYCDVNNSSPPQLTAQNLKLYHSGDGDSDDADDLDSDLDADETESVYSRDSNLQHDMNAEVTTRDCNCCVFCKRSVREVEIQAAHIFTVKERKRYSVNEWMEIKAKYQIDSLYGPRNGFTMCFVCHKMFDRYLLSLECVPEGYKIDCCEGAMQDPLFAYRDHARKIHGSFVSEPANVTMKFHWPQPVLMERRWHIHAHHRALITAEDAEYPLECPLCGKLYKIEANLKLHYNRHSCSKMQISRENGMLGGFHLVRIPDIERKARSDAVVLELLTSGVKKLTF